MNIAHSNNTFENHPQALHVYSCPLPPPEVLARYEKIQPALTQKIIELTEIQGNHRREIENKRLEAQIKHQIRADNEATLGQAFAFTIALFAIGGGLYVALQGYQVAGTIIGTLGLSGLISAFIIVRHKILKDSA